MEITDLSPPPPLPKRSGLQRSDDLAGWHLPGSYEPLLLVSFFATCVDVGYGSTDSARVMAAIVGYRSCMCSSCGRSWQLFSGSYRGSVRPSPITFRRSPSEGGRKLVIYNRRMNHPVALHMNTTLQHGRAFWISLALVR